MKRSASEFVDKHGRRVLTDAGSPGMDAKEGAGSTSECHRNNVAAAIFANGDYLDAAQLDEIIGWLNLYRSAPAPASRDAILVEKATKLREELGALGLESSFFYRSPGSAISPVAYLLVGESSDDVDKARDKLI